MNATTGIHTSAGSVYMKVTKVSKSMLEDEATFNRRKERNEKKRARQEERTIARVNKYFSIDAEV